MSESGGPPRAAAARLKTVTSAQRHSRFLAAASLVIFAALCAPVVFACDQGVHGTAAAAADAVAERREAQRRWLMAADGSVDKDASGAHLFGTDGSAARQLLAPTASRRQTSSQKVAAAAAKKPTKHVATSRRQAWLTHDGAVALPQKKQPPPAAAATEAPTPEGGPVQMSPTAFTTGAMPPNAKPLERRVCAYDEPLQSTENATAALAPRVAFLTSDGAPRGIVSNINTYFHVIGDTSAAFSYVPTSMLTKQIAMLNDAYDSSNFKFTLSGINHVVNKSWYPVDIYSQAFVDMHLATHSGGAGDLNIWVTMLNSGGVIGVASNPWGYGVGDLRLDGVTIDTGTLPGSWYSGYNMGRNAVHETGHWLGLAHPFQGGCSETNDGVADTAQQAQPNYGCYSQNGALPNSCPNKPKGQPNKDPVHNFMGYAPDGCMYQFTPKQTARMTAAWQLYRQAAAGPVKAMSQTTGGGSKKKPTRKPTKKTPKPFCYHGWKYIYSTASRKYKKSSARC